jgi:hypothetical protein
LGQAELQVTVVNSLTIVSKEAQCRAVHGKGKRIAS